MKGLKQTIGLNRVQLLYPSLVQQGHKLADETQVFSVQEGEVQMKHKNLANTAFSCLRQLSMNRFQLSSRVRVSP